MFLAFFAKFAAAGAVAKAATVAGVVVVGFSTRRFHRGAARPGPARLRHGRRRVTPLTAPDPTSAPHRR